MGTNRSIILLTSIPKSWTMVGILRMLLQLNPDRASQTTFQLTLDLRRTLRPKSIPATVDDKFNVTPRDATHVPTFQHYPEHSHYIDPVHLSEQDPTHHQLYEWAHLTADNSQPQKQRPKQLHHGHQWCVNPATPSGDSWNHLQSKRQS